MIFPMSSKTMNLKIEDLLFIDALNKCNFNKEVKIEHRKTISKQRFHA
jgi:hypothetical protein